MSLVYEGLETQVNAVGDVDAEAKSPRRTAYGTDWYTVVREHGLQQTGHAIPTHHEKTSTLDSVNMCFAHNRECLAAFCDRFAK